MTTNDIDADILDEAKQSPANPRYAVTEYVPAAEVEQLRAELEKAADQCGRYARTAADLLHQRNDLAAELEKVRAQLTAANHHTDNLAADVRDMQKANTAYANENARLRSKLAEADKPAGSDHWVNWDGSCELDCPACEAEKSGVAR